MYWSSIRLAKMQYLAKEPQHQAESSVNTLCACIGTYLDVFELETIYRIEAQNYAI